MALLARFFGRAASEGAAFALGTATGPLLRPAVQDLQNAAWEAHSSRPVGVNDAAEIVAEDVEQTAWGRSEANQTGFSNDRFDALVGAVLNAPGMGELLQARRRGLVTDAEFRHGLRKARLEKLWDAALVGLLDVLLTPADLANAVVQGHRSFADALADAEKQGLTEPNFQTLVDNTGLPPGPETLLAWQRRGILTGDEVAQGIREGHTKVKYIPKYEAALHPVLSHVTYAGLRLRGWLTKAEADAGGALTGYTPDQMELEFLDRGRPATAHQIHIGYARGATVPGAPDEVAAIRKAVAESDIRPEYEDVIVAGRYTLPSWFALRSLVTTGAITPARGEQILVQSGWQPDLAKEVVASLAASGAAKPTDPYLAKADSQLWTALHKAYVKTGVVRATVEPVLTRLVPVVADRNEIFTDWDAERTINAAPGA